MVNAVCQRAAGERLDVAELVFRGIGVVFAGVSH
jgi:hypothetical protein